MNNKESRSSSGTSPRQASVESAARSLKRLAEFMLAIGEGRTPTRHPFEDSTVPVKVFARMVAALRLDDEPEAALDQIERDAERASAPYLDNLRLDRHRLLTIRSCVMDRNNVGERRAGPRRAG